MLRGGGIKSFKVHIPLYTVNSKKGRKILQKQNIKEYNYIFVTGRQEHHDDHRFLYEIFKKMIKKQNRKITLVEYESTTPLQTIDRYLDISGVIQTKLKMIEQYPSQDGKGFYVPFAQALNRLRGVMCYTEYAEMYYVRPKWLKLKYWCLRLPKKLQEKLKAKFGEK